MARVQQASQRTERFRRVTSREMEKKILEHLDRSRVLKTSALAAELGHSPRAVLEACKRLYKNDLVRMSGIPYYLYRFPLTGDILQRGNYPVVTRLIALSHGASTGGVIWPNLKRIFASLRQNSALQSSPLQSYISRCEHEAKKVRSEAELQDRIALRPFRSWVAHWWPQSLERQYERPISRIVKRLNKRHIIDAAKKSQAIALEAKRQLALRQSVDANKAEKAVHRALDCHAEVTSYLEDSGAQDLLAKRASQLTSITSLETIPAKDLEVVARAELENLMDMVHGVPSVRWKPPEPNVFEMTQRQLINLVQEALETAATNGRHTHPSGGKRSWRKRLLQSLKLCIGGSLVVIDLSLGFGPLFETLTSVGGGQIGVAISVASSIHTGGKTVLDTLNEMLNTES